MCLEEAIQNYLWKNTYPTHNFNKYELSIKNYTKHKREQATTGEKQQKEHHQNYKNSDIENVLKEH